MGLKKVIKAAICLLFFGAFFFSSSILCRAEANSFITIVNPVRGEYEWVGRTGSPLSGVIIQNKWLAEISLPATWLLRSDAISSAEISSFFKSAELAKGSEIGIFLEITPELAKKAGVSYPVGGTFWHDANKIFLSGYKPEDRIKLIDSVFGEFKETFGDYPRSVGAWHVDAYSAGYMREKYGVTGVLICADQFGTDGYQIWGGWWGVPYYPSRYNILVPAQTAKSKLDLVVYWWASRDPYLGYGGSVKESTFSVQSNDYLLHGLKTDYFGRLLNIYLYNSDNRFGQLTVGLENDGGQNMEIEYQRQINEIKTRQDLNELRVATMVDFSDWYRNNFKSSPPHRIGGWFMDTAFRVGLDSDGLIRDLRIYNDEWPESNLLTANPWRTLSLNNPYKIDSLRFEDAKKRPNYEINAKNLLTEFEPQNIPFKISNLSLVLLFIPALILLVFFCRKNRPWLLLVLGGSIGLSLPLVKSGLVYPFGMGFWGPNGHDGIWHLALINQLRNFSLNNPIFSGTKLANYHFGFDLLAAGWSRLTGIAPVNLYFQVLPPIMAVLIGVLVYQFVLRLTKSSAAGWWATFFVYFGGSWGWLMGLVRTGKPGGESMFWANQAVSTLINPPYALSLIVLLWGVIKLLDYRENPSRKNLLIGSLLFGLLIQIKVYAGIIALGSLGLLSLRQKKIRVLTLASIFISLLVFSPFNIKASSLLVFSPLWFPRTMLAFSDRLAWFKLESARLAYLQSGKWFKWFLAEGLALAIFIFGNLGTRVIGLFSGGYGWKKRRKITEMETFLFSALLISLVLPLLFVQKGNPWNTIQFFYYFQFFVAILAGTVVGRWWDRTGKSKYFLAIVLVGMSLPTSLITLKNDYWSWRAPARVSIEELEALDFLSRQPKGAVLTAPHNREWQSLFSEPRPLYAYETTAYVSALSGKETYLEDEMNLEIMGFDWRKRREEAGRFFLTADQSWGRQFLVDNRIKYIYLVQGQKMNLGLGDINGKKIFENGEVVIYRIKQ